MPERKSLIRDQITNSILCMITTIPVIWLLDKHTGVSAEYLLLYYCMYLFVGILLALTERLHLMYKLPLAIPVIGLIVFRDISLFINCIVALILFIVFMLMYSCRFRWMLMTGTTILLFVLCILSQDVSRIVAVSLVGLAVLCLSVIVKSDIRYALTIVIVIECIVVCINIDVVKHAMSSLVEHTEQFVNSVEARINDMQYYFGQYSDASYIGYDEPGGMFQSLNETHREELTVDLDGRISNIYLKGASYTGITSNGITNRVEEDVTDNSWLALYLNNLYHAGITKEEAKCFSKIVKVHVTYDYIRTEDVMRSSELIALAQDSTEKIHGKDYEYEFRYMALDYANPYLINVVNLSSASDNVAWESYATICDYTNEIYNLNLNSIMDEATYDQACQAYASEEIDTDYLDDSFVTDRIRELTTDITKDCTTDYEKARQIETYLRQYTYDTNVDYRGEEHYVETFLFEEGKGYCAHYASTMVVMLRSVGIPARYTQGFKHVTSKGKEVYSNEAHAWPEAYIEGYGWITFEPTAAYETAADTAWGYMPKEENLPSYTYEPTTESNNTTSAVPDIPVDPEEKRREEAEAMKQNAVNLAKQIGKYLLGLLGIVVALFAVYRLYEWIRYQKMTATEKVIDDFAHLRKKLDRCLPKNEQVESIFDYLSYITIEDCDFKELFTNYNKVRFRGDEPTQEYVQMLHKMAKRRYK